MPINKNNQKQFKEKLKRLHSKIKEDILSLDKEIAEMKETEKKASRDDEKHFTSLIDNINFAEESLYETIISRVELDAIVILADHGFDLVDFEPTKKKETFPLILKKDGVNISLEISSPTKLLLEELGIEI